MTHQLIWEPQGLLPVCVCDNMCFLVQEKKKKGLTEAEIQMTVWRLEGACVEMKKVDRKQVPACGSL